MGVPAFFRWLTVRYPKVVIDALSEDDLEALEEEYAKEAQQSASQQAGDPNEIDLCEEDEEDAALKMASTLNRQQKERQALQDKVKSNNPSVDNLYLDMNGIIHPCSHPPSGPAPQSEAEIFDNIFKYTDKVIRIVKPKKVLYLAIDGVAPRAKINQQRSRRFRAAKDVEEQEIRENEIKSSWKDQINFDETAKDSGYKFDKNVITPGTEFMHRLSIALKQYILERSNTDRLWQGVAVLFSDAFVPGEGEHKILDFIRSQRAQENFDPNTSHCIYGADADLIMLGLATHEPQFYILREAVQSPKDRKCFRCGEIGHISTECGAGYTKDNTRLAREAEFQFVKIAVVREYLYLEFKDLRLPYAFDFERLVDDFVFLCFFVGNDFLPHLPSLQIREGALDAILAMYKNSLPSLDGYLTNQGKINFSNCDVLFRDIAKYEEEFFRAEQWKHERDQRYGNGRGRGRGGRGGYHNDRNQSQDQRSEVVKTAAEKLADAKQNLQKELESLEGATTEKAEKVKKAVKDQIKRMNDEKNDALVAKYVDKVELGKEGYKYRYYSDKFHVHTHADQEAFQTRIRQSYIEGLQWVLSYYYHGCESWDWFYPFHYAPFAADLVKCDKIRVNFVMGRPLRPFEQLMSVFPKQSAHAIPQCYRHLLSDPSSEIIDFYPTEFRLDVNGAAFAWMGVNLLPFIDKPRLLAAMKKADGGYTKLTEQERERNKPTGDICLFIQNGEDGLMKTKLNGLRQKEQVSESEKTLSFASRDIVQGSCFKVTSLKSLGDRITKKTFDDEDEVITESNSVLQVGFHHPHYAEHKTQLLENTILPAKQVLDHEIHAGDKRVFRGEAGIRMVEKVLNIDCGMSHRYKFGFQNNHARHDDSRSQNQTNHYNNFQRASQRNERHQDRFGNSSGQKRSYQQYSGSNDSSRAYQGSTNAELQNAPYDPSNYYASKRQRTDQSFNQIQQPHHQQQQYSQYQSQYQSQPGNFFQQAPYQGGGQANNNNMGPPNPYMSSQPFYEQSGAAYQYQYGNQGGYSQPYHHQQQSHQQRGRGNPQWQNQGQWRGGSRGGGYHRGDRGGHDRSSRSQSGGGGNRFEGMMNDQNNNRQRR